MPDQAEEQAFPDTFGQVLARLDRVWSKVENASNLAAGLLIFALMLLGVVQIVLRTVFRSPLFGYIDIVEISMVGFAVLSIAYVQRVGGHVRMELVLGRLRGRALWLVESAACFAALVIVAILIPSSFEHFQRAFVFGDSTIDIELVTWPSKLVVPIALSILLVRLSMQLFAYMRLVLNPELPHVAIPVIRDTQAMAADEVLASKDDMDSRETEDTQHGRLP